MENKEHKEKKGMLAWAYYGAEYVNRETERRHIIFSNVIFLTLPVVYFLFTLIDIEAFFDPALLWKFDRLIFVVIVSICILCLKLNSWGYVSFSRILFLVSWILLMHVIPIIVQHTPADYYIAYPLGIIFHSFLIHLCFSAHEEKGKFWPFLAMNGILMLTANNLLIMFDQTPESTNVLRTDPYFELDLILYWLLTNLLSFYFLFVFENYINQLSSANELILKHQQEMAQKNKDLENALVSLKKVNDEMEDLNRNLEQKVWERTWELKEKNEKLVQYAFMNSHLLRGPLCRLKGLSILRKMIEPDDEDISQIDGMIESSIQELDQISINIQDVVSENERNNNTSALDETETKG